MPRPDETDDDVAERPEMSDLEPRQDLAALYLATGMRVKNVAEKLAVDERTVCRWRAIPEFRSRVNALRGDVVSQAVGKLAKASTEAAAKLQKLLRDPDPGIQLQAAKAVLDQVAKLRTVTEFEQRLSDLEAAQETARTEGRTA